MVEPCGFRRQSLLRIASLILAAGAASGTFAADVKTISNGERVELTDHLAVGKLTLIDFYADWCGPCRTLAPRLDALAQAHADRFALRKVNVTNFNSPVAAQYGVQAIPHLVLFDEGGQLVNQGNAYAVLREVERRLGSAVAAAGGSDLPSSAGGSGFGIVPLALVAGVALLLIFLLVRKPTPRAERTAGAPRKVQEPAVAPTAKPDASWFVMLQGSLEGPFDESDLESMVRRKVIEPDARVRRRGDRDWSSLRDVLEE